MNNTPILDIPLMQPAQARKHITHNEALLRLDRITQLGVLGRLPAPPEGPQIGARYLVSAPASGAWDGQEDCIAEWAGGSWTMMHPKPGWTCAVLDERRLLGYFDGAWTDTGGGNGDGVVETFGINAQPDADNRFVFRGRNALFDNEDGGLIVKLNRESPSDTASLQFQTGYSSHAEVGLTGTDDFGVKVSADGSSWNDALNVEADTTLTRVNGLYSGSVSVGNDATATLVPPKSGGFVLVLIDHDAFPQLSHTALLAYDVGPSPRVESLGKGTSFRIGAGSSLNGTSGPDGSSTVGAVEGSLIIENRFGSQQRYSYTFIG